jgi:hypothetical protein
MTYTETAYNLNHFATDPLEEQKEVVADTDEEEDLSDTRNPLHDMINQIETKASRDIRTDDPCIICQYFFDPR